MKLVNLSGPEDVLALLMRRKWWVILPFIALSAGALLITVMLPPMYVSESLVVIRPRDVPTDFVKDLTAGTTAERLSIITERLLSGTNLKALLEQVDPLTKKKLQDTPEFAGLNLQKQIVKLRDQIDIDFSSGEQPQKQSITAFRITGQNRDALMAQSIVKRLISVFLDQDKRARQENVNETADFFQNQVVELAVRLEASDTKLKELRSRRHNELPNQLEPNLRRLDTISADNQALRRDRTAYVLNQAQLEQLMAETPKQVPKTPAPKKPTAAPEDPAVDSYRKLRKAIKDHYLIGHTKNWPDVIKLERALQTQEKEMTAEQIALGKEDPVPAPDPEDAVEILENNTKYADMERTLERLKKYIEFIDQRTAENDAKIAILNQHINNVPQGEQELADVLRENNDLNRQYQELSAKLAAARLSESAEVRQKGEQFEVVDPATLPLTATKPSKPMIMIAALVLSLLIALGLAFLVDVVSQKPWTQSDITHLLGVKVLAEVPRIPTRKGVAKAQKKRVGIAASLGIAGVAYVFFLYVAYGHSGFILRQLDPLLQKLY